MSNNLKSPASVILYCDNYGSSINIITYVYMCEGLSIQVHVLIFIVYYSPGNAQLQDQ